MREKNGMYNILLQQRQQQQTLTHHLPQKKIDALPMKIVDQHLTSYFATSQTPKLQEPADSV